MSNQIGRSHIGAMSQGPLIAEAPARPPGWREEKLATRELGVAAYRAGVKRDDSPFKGTALHGDWLIGWGLARKREHTGPHPRPKECP